MTNSKGVSKQELGFIVVVVIGIALFFKNRWLIRALRPVVTGPIRIQSTHSPNAEMRGRSMKRFVAVLSLVLAVAACSGGSQASNDQDSVNLDEQVGLEGRPLIQRQAMAEQSIQGCMRQQGFDYVASDPAEQAAALVGGRNLTEEEFNEQYGYGITTLYEQRLQQAKAGGPNQAYINSLSEADRTAFNRSLYGDDPTATLAVALDSGDFNNLGGCTKQAAEVAFGGAALLHNLTTQLDELDQAILEDPRMVDALKEWAKCMEKAGYDLLVPDEIDTVLEKKLEAIVGEPGSPEAAKPDYDQAALRTLQNEERATVKDDIACEDKHLTKVEDKVRKEYEDRFKEDHADLLEQVPKVK